jgi:hypothetical protein
MHSLSSVYCAITGVSAAHHQEIECIYVANGTYTSELADLAWPGPLTVSSEL